mmetsp:Transcript_48651/g.90283  ORF Transcript_48651/g.90283 Transcript_48651/m.90283 type:complete len:299 (-) Transcript_48651:57-953(-)|eukprot:CAMPEP_0197444900 /NCGR_PEP_ID=MMETSP1175-20131217/10245_1 /TAXON_ID=1003142 /ORGANISM="Triceratium dubium, Strain CCMP147" /LENGTH=298 /DNA_ID=CAMNT_0042975765 /DNA_START=59 /DNA_END=955 /DNA_ORIENTATION=+
MLRYVCLLVLPAAAAAFSSIPADPSFSSRAPLQNEKSDLPTSSETTSSTSPILTNSASPWRIAMDIGREPLARMPFDWARSGCRMPLVVPSDFESNNLVIPQRSTLSFTGPDGANVKPIDGGSWKLSDDSKQITFRFTVPETLTRRDVYIDAGTELVLSGRVYTQDELDRLNDEYYQARKELWQVGGELGDIYDRKDASKKWNEETGRWEKRYPDENPLLLASKHLKYWGAKAKQSKKLNDRPDINKLSDRGTLPGEEGGIYMLKGGLVRVDAENGAVCGTWSAQPINGAAASYRGGN